MSELTKLSLTGALDGLDKGDFSAVELTQAFVDTIEASNDALNAYVVKTPEQALAMAAESDTRRHCTHRKVTQTPTPHTYRASHCPPTIIRER